MIQGNTQDLETMIYLSKAHSSIDEKKRRMEELRAKQQNIKHGEAEIIVIEGVDPHGADVLLFTLANAAEGAEGVCVLKTDIESGAITKEQACLQLCLLNKVAA